MFCENRLNGPRDLREMRSRTDRKTNNPIFHKVETYLDRFLVPEVYAIPNFVKVITAIL